jgi:hypothetical protein
MKTILVSILVLVLSTALWAQQGEGGNECEVWERVVNDNTCGSGGCASVQFQAPNCPNFYLSCQILGNCLGVGNCKVTVRVYEGSDTVGTCQNWDQDPPACGYTGVQQSSITLTPYHWYTLMVCFDACPNQSCSGCSGCYARGRVSVQQ